MGSMAGAHLRARKGLGGFGLGLVLGFATPALAQEAAEEDASFDDIEAALGESMAGEDRQIAEDAAATQEILPEIGEDKLQEFKLNRGFYASSDLGVFQTLGGVSGFSNLQPYMAVKLGFDIGDYFGIQASFSTGHASGNPVSAMDKQGEVQGNETANYGMLNVGAEVVGAIRPTERFALELKGGGGVTRLDPPISDPATGKALDPLSGHLMFGLDLKYLTLLTDFTAGISLSGYYIMTGGGILALGEAFVVRYTF